MEEMLTPWRMRYILSQGKEQGCIFCAGPADGTRERHILSRGRSCFTILNLYPYTVGHLMVIPYRHLARMAELQAEERDEIGRCLARAEMALRRAQGATVFHAGINLERPAGAGVQGHLHVHLVPRGRPGQSPPEGDDLPEPIEETYRRLKPWFED